MLEVVLKNRNTGRLIRSVCEDYKSSRWLQKFIERSEKWDIITCSSTDTYIVPWSFVRDDIIMCSKICKK
jgi:transposase-like protein